jgi:hypothetical protein
VWEDKTDGYSEIGLSTLPIWRESDLLINCSLGVETQSNRPATDHTLEGEVGNSLNPRCEMRWIYELVSARFKCGLHGLLALGLCPEFDALKEVHAELWDTSRARREPPRNTGAGPIARIVEIDRSLCLLVKPSNRVKPVGAVTP